MNLIALCRVGRSMAVGVLALAALALPSQALAATLLFKLDTGADVLAFSLPQQPTLWVWTGDYFAVENVEATLNDNPIVLAYIQFWQGGYARGGLYAHVVDSTGFSAYGPQLYSGPVENPTLLTGDFATQGGTLRVWDAAAPVPEPGAWALMILGFGMIGGLVRLRRAGALVAA